MPQPIPAPSACAPVPPKPARRPFRKSPNQQRVVGRSVLWTFVLGGVVAWLPHLLR